MADKPKPDKPDKPGYTGGGAREDEKDEKGKKGGKDLGDIKPGDKAFNKWWDKVKDTATGTAGKQFMKAAWDAGLRGQDLGVFIHDFTLCNDNPGNWGGQMLQDYLLENPDQFQAVSDWAQGAETASVTGFEFQEAFPDLFTQFTTTHRTEMGLEFINESWVEPSTGMSYGLIARGFERGTLPPGFNNPVMEDYLAENIAGPGAAEAVTEAPAEPAGPSFVGGFDVDQTFGPMDTADLYGVGTALFGMLSTRAAKETAASEYGDVFSEQELGL